VRVLILGHKRHGKDTVAEILRDDHGLSFRSSSEFIAASVVRPAMAEAGITYPSAAACFADRGNHRALWFDIISEYNREDPARLAREILSVADVYVGMRSPVEFEAARDLFDQILWVDASGRGLPPEDSSSMGIAYDPDRMLWVDNGATIADLRKCVGDWARSLPCITPVAA